MPLYRCTLSGFWADEGIWMQNVLHFNDISQVGLDYTQIGDEIRTQWMPKFASFQTATFQWKQIHIQKLGTNETPFPYNALNTPGGSGNNVFHPCIALLFQLRTNLSGRRGRGRFYLPACHTGAISRCNPSTTTSNTWAVNGPQIKARYCLGGNGPLQLVVKHKDEGFEVVTDVLLSPTNRVQRRRNRGVGM